MTLLRCKVGAAQTTVLGVTYNFQPDAAGRFVANVPVSRHVELFLSAGTYEEVDELPINALLQQAAPNLDAIRLELQLATTPAFINRAPEGEPLQIYAVHPWPALVPYAIADMLEGIPDFIVIDPNDRLLIKVVNATATYGLKGTADGVRLYELLDGSTFTEFVEPPVTEPVIEAPPNPPAEPAKPDDLTKINGIGAATAKKLTEAGFTTFAQIAMWDAAKVTEIDAALSLHGAIVRDKWVEQAIALVAASTPA